MKTCVFITTFLLLVWPATLQAQTTWITGKITDEQKNGLAFVNIGIPGTTTGTVSGIDGDFKLALPPDFNASDTLRISHIGYQPYYCRIKDVLKNPSAIEISLEPLQMQLETVLVKPLKTKIKTLGSQRETTVISTNFAISNQPMQNLGAAIGKPFNLKGSAHFLKQLNVFIAYNTFDTVTFRVQVNRLRNGKPGENLLNENIYWTLTNHKKGWATFNLEPYNLMFSEKVLVSIEWVGHSKKGKYIGLPLVMPLPGARHFYRFGSQNNWKTFYTMSTSINLVTETSR